MGFAEVQKLFAGKIKAVRMMYPQKLPPDAQEMFAEKFDGLVANGVPEDLVRDITRC